MLATPVVEMVPHAQAGAAQTPSSRVKPRPNWTTALAVLILLDPAYALHHLKQPVMHTVNRRDSDIPLHITNQCSEDIYPAILTQSGAGPPSSGFLLVSGNSTKLTVSANWQGRVWGRTNCTFDENGHVPASGQGRAPCSTGDCGQFVECAGAGNPPATLAEFTMSSAKQQTFYDISLVDGYNLPMGIKFLASESSNRNLSDIPPNLTNPICIGSSALLEPSGSTSDSTFGTNATFPIPLEQTMSSSFVSSWCPFPLLAFPPKKPGDGVYPYPDDNIKRPLFNPCYSACAKWNLDRYCCAGKHASPSTCKPSYYSTQAKKVCPDAYSYAYDDQTSTFIIPEGGGFEVVFCPSGRSSKIISTLGAEMQLLAQTGHVTRDIEENAKNASYIALKSDAGPGGVGDRLPSNSVIALVVLLVCICIWG